MPNNIGNEYCVGYSAGSEQNMKGRQKTAFCYLAKVFTIISVKAAGLVFVFTFFNWLSAACVVDVSGYSATATQPWSGVDPVFREAYRYMGGEKILGPAISDLLVEDGLQVQYLKKGKLVYDRDAPDTRKLYFAPLAEDNGFQEPSLPPPQEANPYYIDGHYIYEAFWPLYVELTKMADVGPPLTEVRYNPDHRRYEQFFAGLGFYQLEGSTDVRLLAYGEWACDRRCRPIGLSNNAINDDKIDVQAFIDPTFASFTTRMGADFTGFPLTDPYLSQDGTWKQIFERLVLVANSPNFVDSVKLGPLAKLLGIASDPLRSTSDRFDMVFYPIDGDLGYDIPVPFWEYIEAHGGIDVFGPPITHYAPLFTDGTYHQCYVNLCLMHNPSADGGMLVHPEALGHAYKKLYYDQDLFQGDIVAPADEVQLHVWERYPSVASSQRQEIDLIIYKNDLPLANVTPVLTLGLPDGSNMTLQMPSTSPEGRSSLTLEPISARGSSIISYDVCVSESGIDVCSGDSFLIWNNP